MTLRRRDGQSVDPCTRRHHHWQSHPTTSCIDVVVITAQTHSTVLWPVSCACRCPPLHPPPSLFFSHFFSRWLPQPPLAEKPVLRTVTTKRLTTDIPTDTAMGSRQSIRRDRVSAHHSVSYLQSSARPLSKLEADSALSRSSLPVWRLRSGRLACLMDVVSSADTSHPSPSQTGSCAQHLTVPLSSRVCEQVDSHHVRHRHRSSGGVLVLDLC
jgi:hypothetical protein